MRQQARAELFIILAIATVLELFLDAVLGDAIKQYLPIPHLTGFGVVILLLIVLWWRIEKMEMLLGGKKMGRNVKVKAFNVGKVGLIEIVGIVVYLIAALVVFGLATMGDALAFVKDYAWLLCVGSVVVVLGSDKKIGKKKQIEFTGLEGLALIIAIFLPLAAAGYLTAVGIDISTYLADATQKIVLFLISIGSVIVVATQD